jgi:hypothetical protein
MSSPEAGPGARLRPLARLRALTLGGTSRRDAGELPPVTAGSAGQPGQDLVQPATHPATLGSPDPPGTAHNVAGWVPDAVRFMLHTMTPRMTEVSESGRAPLKTGCTPPGWPADPCLNRPTLRHSLPVPSPRQPPKERLPPACQPRTAAPISPIAHTGRPPVRACQRCHWHAQHACGSAECGRRPLGCPIRDITPHTNGSNARCRPGAGLRLAARDLSTAHTPGACYRTGHWLPGSLHGPQFQCAPPTDQSRQAAWCSPPAQNRVIGAAATLAHA